MMKRAVVGCLVGLFGVMSLHVMAQDVVTTSEPEPQVLNEVTVEAPLPTVEPSIAPEIIATATSTPISTPTVITDSPIVTTLTTPATQGVIVLPPSNGNAQVVPSQTPVPSSTPSLRAINGQALYPNRLLGQALIRVQAFAPDGTVLSTAYTDAKGLYSLTGLADQVTRVQIDAPLYLAETQYLAPGLNPQITILRAGDLDGDACVGAADIALLTVHYGQPYAGADLDGSGVVDVVDLTLLSSNYQDTCTAVVPVPTVTPSVIAPDVTDEAHATAELTAEPSVVAPLPTDEVIATEEPTLAPPTATPLPTQEASPVTPSEPAPEATAEATAQL